MKVKVAVLQYDCPGESEASFLKLREMTYQASFMGAQLVVAPETAAGSVEEVKSGKVDYFSKLAQIALDAKVYLATSYYSEAGGKFYNQGFIVSPEGKPVVSHKKIYPARPEVESIGVVAGETLEVGQSKIGKLGMLICKDGFNKYSHFLYEKLEEMGAEIICIPTWSIGWKEINTQEYVKGLYVYGAFRSRAFVLRSGNLNKMFNSYGRSLIVSPIRGILSEGSVDKKEILMEEIDLDEVRRAREFDSWWQPKEAADLK